MAVNSTHPSYDAALPAWLRARDVLAGEDAVKAAGTKYLPRLDSQSDEEYAAYVARASFFGATARTLEEYLDMVFRRAPVVAQSSEALAGFLNDCDGWGTAFVRYARRVVGEVLSVGRAGSLVVYDADSGKPCVSLWRAEDILNWEVARSDGRSFLTGLVLKDRPSPDGSGATGGERVRVLRMGGEADETNGKNGRDGTTNGTDGGQWEGVRRCVMEAWGRVEGTWCMEERRTLKRDGVALTFIPFVFHGPQHSRPEPDRLPLAAIIAANLDHYRLDADYKHGLHFTALPTAWVSGFDKGSPLRIGASTAWVSEVAGAAAGFLEFSGAGLGHIERAMEKVERRMAVLGAGMLEGTCVGTSVPGTGGAASPRASLELCGLGSIVASLNESLSQVLRIAQWWIEGGELRAQNASIVMETDLSARVVNGELISAVVGAWRGGAISRDTMLDWLKRWEVLPEGRSVGEERALIHGKGRER